MKGLEYKKGKYGSYFNDYWLYKTIILMYQGVTYRENQTHDGHISHDGVSRVKMSSNSCIRVLGIK